MFKDTFKYYKSKNPPPTLTNVLDFRDIEKLSTKVRQLDVSNTEQIDNNFGLKPVQTWEIFELTEHPGFIFIKNPFTSIGQRYWTVRCLRDYTRKPNRSNLDAENVLSKDKDWWDVCQNNNNTNTLLLNKLRWVTFGYHHNWDTKIYSEDSKSDFPNDLSCLSKYIMQVLGHLNFNAEAAILNLYHMDSTLSGHTDFSEENLDAPLISFSFGQTAIFLLGGRTKEDGEPTAMFLRSGDIAVMSKESRLSVHGVPKILQMDSRFWDGFEETANGINKECKSVVNICRKEELWKPFDNYLNHSRININVRQVLNRGQKRLCNESKDQT